MEPLQTTYRPRRPLDLRATVGCLQRGPGDPSQQRVAEVTWRATRTPAGVATVALAQQSDGSVRAAAWGDGSEWALAQVPALCGACDDDREFDASLHPLVAEAHRRRPGLRLARTDLVFTALAQAIVEQKVTVRQAFGAWRRLTTWHGTRAPGPTPRPMYAPPAPDQWRAIPSWAWHRAGLEPPQAKTLVRAAARADAVERAARTTRYPATHPRVHAVSAPSTSTAPGRGTTHPTTPRGADIPIADAAYQARMAPASAGDPLLSLPGIGPWTAAETRIRALGDPDAVSVGDFHLAHHIGYALTGSRTDDDGMLSLLEPWRGQRQRVIRLLLSFGAGEPRRAPRLHVEDHRSR